MIGTHHHSQFYWWRWSLVNFSFGLASNLDPPNCCLLIVGMTCVSHCTQLSCAIFIWFITLNLWTRKLKVIDMKRIQQGHTICKWLIWNVYPGLSDSKDLHFSPYHIVSLRSLSQAGPLSFSVCIFLEWILYLSSHSQKPYSRCCSHLSPSLEKQDFSQHCPA
jgi:hypothetical protein